MDSANKGPVGSASASPAVATPSEVATAEVAQNLSSPTDRLDAVLARLPQPMPTLSPAMQKQAAVAKAVFVDVPRSDVEKLPDPDYEARLPHQPEPEQ